MKEYKVVIYQENPLSSLFFGAAKSQSLSNSARSSTAKLPKVGVSNHGKDQRRMLYFSDVKPTSSFWSGNVFKLGVCACLGLFVGWVLLLILATLVSFIEAELFFKITL